MTQPVRIELRYPVRTREDEWAIPENWPVPQSVPHGVAVKHITSVLTSWANRQERPLFVANELAVRWLRERPAVGIDPDLCLLDPPPPGLEELTSLRLWLPGHVVPALCVEVVSDNHPYKDYVEVQERYAAFGAPELVVFDPRLIGPKSLGGPFAIQIWRTDAGVFERTYAGAGPSFSEALGAWLRVDDGLPQITSDRAGKERWPTEAEFERSIADLERREKEQARAEKEQERAEKEQERAEKERERAEKERERADKEQERAQRIELERRLAALEQRLQSDPER